jgi:hypothetical protein
VLQTSNFAWKSLNFLSTAGLFRGFRRCRCSAPLLPVRTKPDIRALGRHPLIVHCTAAGPVGLSRLEARATAARVAFTRFASRRTASASANLRLDVRRRRAGFDEAVIDLASRAARFRSSPVRIRPFLVNRAGSLRDSRTR